MWVIKSLDAIHKLVNGKHTPRRIRQEPEKLVEELRNLLKLSRKLNLLHMLR